MVFGWFEFQETYEQMILKYDSGIFVEIGCYMGASAMYLGQRVKETGKDIQIVCVDLWPNQTELDSFLPETDNGQLKAESSASKNYTGDSLMDTFINNINFAGIREYVYPIRCRSDRAARLFQDKSVKFIFIDAGHSYEQVMRDLEAWYPKLADDGTIAGHDYWGDVEKAANEFFDDKGTVKRAPGHTWIFNPESKNE